MSDLERLKIDVEPRLILLTSEPYVCLTSRGFQAAVRVYEKKKKREFELLIGSKSLSDALLPLVEENGEKFNGLEFWIRKGSADKFAQYVIEQ